MLHERIASALGWSPSDARSFSLASLRELVRGNPKLEHEITVRIRSGEVCRPFTASSVEDFVRDEDGS